VTLEVDGEQVMWGETEVGSFDSIIAENLRALKQHMRNIQVRKPSVKVGAVAIVEFFGGTEKATEYKYLLVL